MKIYKIREEKADAVKAAFYANLENLHDKCPAHNIKTVIGISTRRSCKKLSLVPLSDCLAATQQLRPTALD